MLVFSAFLLTKGRNKQEPCTWTQIKHHRCLDMCLRKSLKISGDESSADLRDSLSLTHSRVCTPEWQWYFVQDSFVKDQRHKHRYRREVRWFFEIQQLIYFLVAPYCLNHPKWHPLPSDIHPEIHHSLTSPHTYCCVKWLDHVPHVSVTWSPAMSSMVPTSNLTYVAPLSWSPGRMTSQTWMWVWWDTGQQ